MNIKFDSNINLNYSKTREIESAYIITIHGNADSESMSERCAKSCQKNDMKYKIWPAFDGTKGEIITPEHLKGKDWVKWIKNMDHHLSSGEIACFLSHASLWAHCITIDEPITIFEHDAIVLQKFDYFMAYNNIIYLGGAEQYKQGWPVLPIPTHASININYHFIGRAHAYAIDPQMAKNLMSHLLSNGIQETLDIFIRADRFGIIQMGLCAYDESGKTTIEGRKPDVNLSGRNNKNLIC